MPTYWLDADSYIQSKNGPYPFEMVPQFWSFLSEKLDEGAIRSSKLVHDELKDYKDWLANWVRQRKSRGLCVSPDSDVQTCLGIVAAHCISRWGQPKAYPFLSGGDAWTIAHAMADGDGIVVTHESQRSKDSRVKIPTVCKELGVRCINIYAMLRELGFKIDPQNK